MKKWKAFIAVGSAALVTAAGVITFRVSADQSQPATTGLLTKNSILYSLATEDEDVKKYVDEIEQDFNTLTKEEQDELLRYYDRAEDIVIDIIPESLKDFDFKAFEEHVASYEDELEALASRVEELQDKAGLDDMESAIAFALSLDKDELVEKVTTLLDNTLGENWEENAEKALNDLLDDLQEEFAEEDE